MKEKIIKAHENNSDLYEFENLFWQKNKLVCGVDEVGRGCLAGPIVTAAVILNPYATHPKLKDSKLLSSLQLENIYKWIITNSAYTYGISNHRIIDKKNIYATTQITMKKALFHLLQSTDQLPAVIAIDAMPLSLANTPYDNIQLESWTQGESKSASIAAASIIAKVTRDKLLQKMSASFPAYGLAQHKGYGTATHIAALQEHQASIIHRKTFIKNFKRTKHEKSEQQNLFC
ncbi:ribonuclease HII [Candidatus Babeliales bacterium]|nr:ribonuclease HII [Candidatus Babeliales bacterium]MBP9844085.1 ribonuclease HII [Candidatus Babeliales bacterium]